MALAKTAGGDAGFAFPEESEMEKGRLGASERPRGVSDWEIWLEDHAERGWSEAWRARLGRLPGERRNAPETPPRLLEWRLLRARGELEAYLITMGVDAILELVGSDNRLRFQISPADPASVARRVSERSHGSVSPVIRAATSQTLLERLGHWDKKVIAGRRVSIPVPGIARRTVWTIARTDSTAD
jgi:hypothetical protein